MIRWLDVESMGLVGPMLLMQEAEGDGEVELHDVFRQPTRTTLHRIERLVDSTVGGFNLVFDWWQVQRAYCVLRLLDPSEVPTVKAWNSHLRASVHGPCLKPRGALDLMLYARKGPMQSLMERDDVRIRRVPRVLARPLADELTSRIKLDSIYFAKRKDGSAWKVEEEPTDPEFPDLVLSFGAAGGLKPLARHLLGVDAMDLPVPDAFKEKQDTWNPLWQSDPVLTYYHIAFWSQNQEARRYAREDVEHTRNLWRYWQKPAPNDVDSLLAIAVACARHKGFNVNLPLAAKLEAEAHEKAAAVDTAPAAVLRGLHARLTEPERMVIDNTRGETLELLSKVDGPYQGSPVQAFAKAVIDARTAEKEEDILRKLRVMGRFHFDMKVIGALSGRMSGASGLNAHGMNREGHLRECLTLADEGEWLEGGDFDGFEVTIADAVYKDPVLHEELKTGKKVHALFGQEMYQLDYATVKNSAQDWARVAGAGWDGNLYDPSKHGFLGLIYGAQAPKVSETMRLSLEATEEGLKRFWEKYTVMHQARRKTETMFCSMRQPNGPGTRVYWHEPADSIVSLFGFPRFFTLENSICRALYELSCDLPDSLASCDVRVVRRQERGAQKASGAVRSALYSCAFQIQARNMRSAGNHEIQATGAAITKDLQLTIWNEQPQGIHEWLVRPTNMHDEVPTPTRKRLTGLVATVLERNRRIVPLLSMDWLRADNWWMLKSTDRGARAA